MHAARIKYSLFLLLLPALLTLQSCSGSEKSVKSGGEENFEQMWDHSWIDYDTVQAGQFDTGKMWTFEDAPVDYFEKTYGFRPSQEWLDDVMKSALRFSSWCSGSFVSQDGLIMTNHHCVDFIVETIQKEGENLSRDGFYAETLEDERKVPNLYVDQLMLIEDVSEQIKTAMDKGNTPEEKIELRNAKMKEISEAYEEETGLTCQVTALYKGGKYSLYGYRRYTDVRAAFIVETSIGFYGGDPDNFTYPRYNLDCSFLRVYDDNGQPLKTDNYFKWSPDGAKLNEPLFVIGRPGSTNRQNTVAQLLYRRDIAVKNSSFILSGNKKIIEEAMEVFPERVEELNQQYLYLANSEKVYDYLLKGLRDRYLIARKMDWEEDFKEAVNKDPKLKDQFGDVWEGIANLQEEKRQVEPEFTVYNISPRGSNAYYVLAAALTQAAKELSLPAEERSETFKNVTPEQVVGTIYPPAIDDWMEKRKVELHAELTQMNLGMDSEAYRTLFGDKEGMAAVEYLLNNSIIDDKEKVEELFAKGPDAFLNSGDPLVNFALASKEKTPDLRNRLKEIAAAEDVLEDRLGQALFAVYGPSVPPDATSTLRISDGVMLPYEYNGTKAPTHTTFHGMFDRYYSHSKQAPWILPDHWLNAENLDRETPYNFVSTCDITGGSSGSPVINKNAEIVGLAFDGNIESIPGDFIYTVEGNRMVSVASQGMLEAISDVYNAKRLAEEIRTGKMFTPEPEEETEETAEVTTESK